MSEAEKFYKELKHLLKYSRKNVAAIVVSNFNITMGRGRIENIVGKHSLEEHNERGDTLMQFLNEDENFIIKIT